MSGINRDAWLQALQAVGGDALEDDPDALTAQEFADLMGMARSTAQKRLRELVEAGKAQLVTKRVPRGLGGGTYPSPAYRLTK